MNKTERMVVVLLFAALIGWSFLSKKTVPPASTLPDTAENVASADEGTPAASPSDTSLPVQTNGVEAVAEAVAEVVPVVKKRVPSVPKELVVLTNDVVRVSLSSWGATIESVELTEFDAERGSKDTPLVLDFSTRPSLSMGGIEGLDPLDVFDIDMSRDRSSAVLSRTTDTGLHFERYVAVTNGYNLTVVDRIRNAGEEVRVLPAHTIGLGPMHNVQTGAKVRGPSTLGIDTLANVPKGDVTYWGKRIPKELFGAQGGCSKPNVYGMPMGASRSIAMPMKWVAAKNKFFVEILTPEWGCEGATIFAERDQVASNVFTIATVSADLLFPEKALEAGQTETKAMSYYVGPKKYLLLRSLGDSRGEVMQFGFFGPVCKVLLPVLNAIHYVLPNYGVAIILLTILVKVIFWPVTHKGTESMKKMQKIQPEVKKLRDKYKDNPKKLQEQQMLLYKQHGVNPLAGCLPMVVQIPVFIGLFTVLRSAVELRFAPFLWIKDLSEPEGLFAGMIPLVGSLNILPLVMSGTMVLQQKLTPSAGDPQQQKMMMFMPIMMLFIFYNMPSALVLYWSVSQGLSILQLVMQHRKTA